MAAYQGWKNYETWNIALWFNNDEGLYSTTREFIEEDSPSTQELADYIDNLFTEPDMGLMPELPNGPTSDILGWAYEEVSWKEVAENFLED